MSNYIFQIGVTSLAPDIDKVEDMVKLEETVKVQDKGHDPSLKLRKIVALTCGEGKEADERVLHVSGSNIPLLKLPENVRLAKPRTAHMRDLGRKELEFEVLSVAACGDTAVLVGDT